MSFKMVKGGKWDEVYNFVYMPDSINPIHKKNEMNQESKIGDGDLASNIVEREEPATTRKKNI